MGNNFYLNGLDPNKKLLKSNLKLLVIFRDIYCYGVVLAFINQNHNYL